jgi:hypothetical protein
MSSSATAGFYQFHIVGAGSVWGTVRGLELPSAA